MAQIDIRSGVKQRARLVGLAAAFAACLACLSLAAAQEGPPAGTNSGEAAKIDEYGRLYGCDPGARLDNLAHYLTNSPGLRAFIVGYDARRGPPGLAKSWIEIQRGYLVHARGVEESRIEVVAPGRHAGKELKVELWLVPQGASPPATTALPAEERPFSGKFAQVGASNTSEFNDFDGEIGAGAYSFFVSYDAFADVLKRQADSQGYVVAYTQKGSAPGTWRRLATREAARFEARGVDPARLTIVSGGRRDENSVEFWIAPKDAPPPVKAVKREPALSESEMIGSFTSYGSGDDPAERKWLLDNFAEMLRADTQRVGCLVVFRDDAPAEIDAADGSVTPAFDYLKLAEEWREELASRYGIEAHRVVLLVGRAGKWQSAGLETWVVPKGVSLPDPAEIVRQREAEMNAEPQEEP